jgi:hypothetical protein
VCMYSTVKYGAPLVEKALAMLGFLKRLSCEFSDPYTLKTLYVSLVLPKLQYVSCVLRSFYGAHIDRIERVQRKFLRYVLRGLDWRTCAIFFHSWTDARWFVSRHWTLCLEGWIHHIRASDFLQIDYHCTN